MRDFAHLEQVVLLTRLGLQITSATIAPYSMDYSNTAPSRPGVLWVCAFLDRGRTRYRTLMGLRGSRTAVTRQV